MIGPDVGFATALASLPGVGPSRLRVLLGLGEPGAVWSQVLSGTLIHDPSILESLGRRSERLVNQWRDAARRLDPTELERRQSRLGIRLVEPSDPDYPERFRDDPEPPLLLWALGDPSCLRPRSVAIVGTRRCTRYGHDVARRFGFELAAAWVSVISGLALGIDAAAHSGVIDAMAGSGRGGAPPIGVVGTGLDVVYPSRNRSLWKSVGEQGVLLSEAPPGAKAEPWRFPARNRLIAALADIVLVVESTERGGSLYTVDEALARDVEVRVVPGPITSPSSAGTNRLLSEGAHPALSPTEVMQALGLEAESAKSSKPDGETDPFRDPDEQAVLDVLTAGALTFDDLAERLGLRLEHLGLVVARLRVEGAVVQSGGWYEATG